jgi:hypothetical protein
MRDPPQNSEEHKSEGNPKGKAIQPQKPQEGGRTRRSTKGPLIICGSLSALLILFGEMFVFFTHAPKLLSCSLLLVGIALASYSLRTELSNHHFTKRRARFWAIVLLIIGSILCGVSVWVKNAEEREAQGAGSASRPPATTQVVLLVTQPSSQPTIPIKPLEFRQKHDSVVLVIGNDEFVLPAVAQGKIGEKNILRGFLGRDSDAMKLFATSDDIILEFEYAPRFGMPPLKLEHNELSGLPSNWGFNHTSRAIEVVDDTLMPILQLYYKDDTHLVFNGVFTYTNGLFFASDTAGLWGADESVHVSQEEFNQRLHGLHLKKLFKYPAFKYPGQFAEERPEDLYSGVLEPANDPMPRDVSDFWLSDPPSNSTFLFAGNNIFGAARCRSVCLLSYNHECLISLDQEEKADAAFISASFFDEDGKLVAELSSNGFEAAFPPTTFRVYRPNKSTLIVRDGRGKEVLNLKYLNSSAFEMTGVFCLRDKQKITITKEQIDGPNGNAVRNVRLGAVNRGPENFNGSITLIAF